MGFNGRVLLEFLSANHMRSLKSLKDFGTALRYFDEQTSFILSKQLAAQKEHSQKYHFNKGKAGKSGASSELELTKKFNKLVKVSVFFI